MKKVIIFLFSCLGLSACRMPTPVFVDIERATLYHGQSVISLYDNFGAPQQHFLDPYGIHELRYKFEDIQNRGLGKQYYFCELLVYLDDDIVVDWQWHGNKCHINTTEKNFYLDLDR